MSLKRCLCVVFSVSFVVILRPIMSTSCFSPFQDDFFVIHVTNDYDSVLESIFKTEFLHVLSKKYQEKAQKKLEINFNDKLELHTSIFDFTFFTLGVILFLGLILQSRKKAGEAGELAK